jgi:hypothetical protein
MPTRRDGAWRARVRCKTRIGMTGPFDTFFDTFGDSECHEGERAAEGVRVNGGRVWREEPGRT